MTTLGFIRKVIHHQILVVEVWFSLSFPEGMIKASLTTDHLCSPRKEIHLNMESELNSHLFWIGILYQDLNLVLLMSLRDGEFIRMALAYSSVITVTVSWSLK